jgi:hypothetical protein
MLARADLRERPDAKAGLPRYEPIPDASGQPSGAAQSHDRDADLRRGQMMRNERRVAVRSGELTVGVLERATHGDETWAWFLTGLHRPDDPEFIWQGDADREQEAFESFAGCWRQWLEWAGLEQVGDLQRGVKR